MSAAVKAADIERTAKNAPPGKMIKHNRQRHKDESRTGIRSSPKANTAGRIMRPERIGGRSARRNAIQPEEDGMSVVSFTQQPYVTIVPQPSEREERKPERSGWSTRSSSPVDREKEFHSFHRAGESEASDKDHHHQDKEERHEEFRNPLNPLLNAERRRR